ncbi:DUF4325 domain-containing protein [bacterium]|nr:DUF4325 domain-containing protein [bacterium]
MKIIKVSDWIKTLGTGGREFREKVFEQAIKTAIATKSRLIVDLDGTIGYRPSFLKEAFIDVLRDGTITISDFERYVEFKSSERPSYVLEIKRYIDELKKK